MGHSDWRYTSTNNVSCVVHVPSLSVDDILLPLGMLHCVFNEVMGWSKGVPCSWSMVSHNEASMKQHILLFIIVVFGV